VHGQMLKFGMMILGTVPPVQFIRDFLVEKCIC
jgi:hypothetical protein